MTAPDPNSKMMTRREAAAYLAERGCPIAFSTLGKLACVGGGPLIEYFGRKPMYRREHIDAWIAARTSPPVSSKSEARSLTWAARQPRRRSA